jgi:hypothetical protein
MNNFGYLNNWKRSRGFRLWVVLGYHLRELVSFLVLAGLITPAMAITNIYSYAQIWFSGYKCLWECLIQGFKMFRMVGWLCPKDEWYYYERKNWAAQEKIRIAEKRKAERK